MIDGGVKVGCVKCNDTGMVQGEPKKETVVNGPEFEYPTMRFCSCKIYQKEQEVKAKINIPGKKSWVDKYVIVGVDLAQGEEKRDGELNDL
jgi:hypothetical protein